MHLYNAKLNAKLINKLNTLKQVKAHGADNRQYSSKAIKIVYGPVGSGKSVFIRKRHISKLQQHVEAGGTSPNYLYHYLQTAIEERGMIVIECYDLSDCQFNRTLEAIAAFGLDIYVSCQGRPKIENINGLKMIIETGYPDFEYIVTDNGNRTKIFLSNDIEKL